MPLNDNDITNIQRGADAAIDTIIRLAIPRAVILAGPPYDPRHVAASEFIGFLNALSENRFGLSNMALQKALMEHPEEVADEQMETSDDNG